MTPEEIHAWLKPPSDSDCRDAVAILRTFHVEDVQGLATLFANAEPLGALKGMLSCFEVYLAASGVDTCDVVGGLLAGMDDADEQGMA